MLSFLKSLFSRPSKPAQAVAVQAPAAPMVPEKPVEKPVEKTPQFTAVKDVAVKGDISERFESGGRGVGTVSTGRGDHGGVSYGKHQLATNNGSMAKFLKSTYGAPYRNRFLGLASGSKEFNAEYKKIAKEQPQQFEQAQFLYIVESHYDVQAKLLNSVGLALASRHRAVRECVFSVAVQYGANTSLIKKALANAPLSMSDETFIKTVQQYRKVTVPSYFKSSSKAVQASIVERADVEKTALLHLLANGV